MTTHRKCGDCQLCCRLMPTEEIGKPANVRCSHQCTKGCRIHARKPMSCTLWNCRWLVNDDMADQPRPDRTHIVIDMMPDVIRVRDNETGQVRTAPVIVAWVDPAHKGAEHAAAFQRYVRRQTVPVLIRYGSSEGGGVFFPPATTGEPTIKWQQSELGQDMPNTLAEKAAAIGASISELPEPGVVGAVTLTMPDGTTRTIAARTKLG